MDKRPDVSIVVPIHDMKDGEKFLWRLVNSLTEQSFKNWELIITKEGKMAENTNKAIKRAHGRIIKILYLDDYFSVPDSLWNMVINFQPEDKWMMVGTNDNYYPKWTDDIETGNNRLGSPSALIMRNHKALMFDENMSWLLDCDLYRRLYNKYGMPKILNGNYITIGKGDHQMTHILTDEEKLSEHEYMAQKYEK